MERDEFSVIYERIKLATDRKTQAAVADALGIKQSSISDAKNRRTVPDSWVVTLFERYNVSVSWLLYGAGAMVTGEFLDVYSTVTEEIVDRMSLPQSLRIKGEVRVYKSGDKIFGVDTANCSPENDKKFAIRTMSEGVIATRISVNPVSGEITCNKFTFDAEQIQQKIVGKVLWMLEVE